MVELKPCPFCGENLTAYSEAEGYYHSLKNCTLSGFEIRADGYSEERWNTRAAEQPQAAEIARLRTAVMEVLAAVRDYLPPDGISKDECLNRVIGAVDNLAMVAPLKI